MTSQALAWRQTWTELLHAKWARATALVLLVVFVAFAGLEYRAGTAFALNRLMKGGLLGIVIPLSAFAVTEGLSQTVQKTLELARLGANRRWLVSVAALSSAGCVGLFAACLGALGYLALSHGTGPLVPSLPRVLLACGLGGFCYSLVCSSARTLYRHGAGLALLIDWLLGFGNGAAANLVPRSHLRHLADPLFAEPGPQAIAALLAISLISLGALALRQAP